MAGIVYSCIADDRQISLDLRRGRYFARAGGPAPAGQAPECGPVAVASVDLEWIPPLSPDRRDGLLALGAILFGRIAVAILPFERLFHLAPPRNADDVRDPVRLTELVCRYKATRRYIPLAPLCLPDSLALRQFLLWHGQHSDIVIGVTGNPFSAHCWLQAGDLLLSDRTANVGRLSPILSTRCLAGC